MPGGVPLLSAVRSRHDAFARRVESAPEPMPTAHEPGTSLEAKLVATLAELLAESKRSAAMLAEMECLKRELLEQKAELAERIANVPRYVGIYEPGRTYHPGEMTTDRGSIWCCRRTTSSRPDTLAQAAEKDRWPEGGRDWELSVRRGQNGKDAR